jgi:hypothetical protein
MSNLIEDSYVGIVMLCSLSFYYGRNKKKNTGILYISTKEGKNTSLHSEKKQNKQLTCVTII